MTLQKEIVFSKSHIDILRKHAKAKIPNESCAILFGKNENGRFITKEIFLTNNEEPSPYSFRILADEWWAAYNKAENEKMEIGIFHSHPDSVPYPSNTDRESMEWNPYPWVIFSNITNEFKCYILESTVIPIVVTIL